MSSRAVSSTFLSILCCHCHWNEVPVHEWPGEESLGCSGTGTKEHTCSSPQGLQAAAPVVTCPWGLEPTLWPAKISAGKPSCSASPAQGERDGARLHSKVHSSQAKYCNYLKWVVDWSYNWGLVSQCYCNVSADPLQQSAQCPHSLQLFKTYYWKATPHGSNFFSLLGHHLFVNHPGWVSVLQTSQINSASHETVIWYHFKLENKAAML